MPVSLKDIQGSTAGLKDRATEKPTSTIERLLSYEIGGNKLNDQFKESFYGELALMLEAGMHVKSALDLLTEQQKKEKLKKLLSHIVTELTMGARFSEVIQREGRFTAYEYYSIHIGEETGNLIEVLKRLASYYSKKIQQRRTIIGALTYPLVIMFTAFAAVAFMLVYMVPMFEDVFGRMGGKLPWLTQLIIGLADSFDSFIKWLLVLIVLIIGVHLINRDRKRYQEIRSSIVKAIPLVGPMILRNYMLRLSQSLSLLITSRVPLTEALELTGRMVKFYPVQSSLLDVRAQILKGDSLYQAMSRHSIYDQRLIALIRVGEETNQLGPILNKLSAQMEEEVQHKAKVIGNTLEPLIIVFLGFIVALILISMYLPMFQVSSGF